MFPIGTRQFFKNTTGVLQEFRAEIQSEKQIDV